MKKQIFLCFSCDEWKSKDSMRMEIATTSVRRLKSFIVSKIKRGDYDYGDANASRAKQIAEFKRDFDWFGCDDTNDMLTYGYIECIHDGEEL